MKDDKKLREEILKLRNKGMSLEAIAKALKISKPKVHYQLKMAEIEALKMEYEQKLKELQRKEAELREWELKLKEKEKRIAQKAREVYQEEIKKKQKEIEHLKEEIKRLESKKRQLEAEITLLQRRIEKLRSVEFSESGNKKAEDSIKLKTDVFETDWHYVIQFYVNKNIELFRWELETEIEEKLKMLDSSSIEIKWLIPIFIIQGYIPLLRVEIRKYAHKLNEIVKLIEKIARIVEEELKKYVKYLELINNDIAIEKELI